MDKRYEDMSLAQLKELAKEHGIKGISTLKKSELAELIAKNASDSKKNISEENQSVVKPVKKTMTKKTTDRVTVTEESAEKKPVAKKAIGKLSMTEKSAEKMPTTKKTIVKETVNEKDTDKKVISEGNTDKKPVAKKVREKVSATEEVADNRTVPEAVSGKKPVKENTTVEKARIKNADDGALTVEKDIERRGAVQRTENGRGVQRLQPRQRISQTEGRPILQQPRHDIPQTEGRPILQQPRYDISQSEDRPVPQQPRYEAQQQDNRPDNQTQQSAISNRQETRGMSIEEKNQALDSGETKEGILEVMADGYGFIRCDNFLPGENDVYVSPAQIRRLNLKTGDFVVGNTKIRSQTEKFGALLYVKSINGLHPAEAARRKKFEDLTPIFPNQRLHLETPGCGPAMRMVDLISPIGKGQRGMIVSQPKAGKTTLLKQIAKAIKQNHPEMHLIILLIDERPEEVTDMKESIQGSNVEVIYSTFDELPDNHKRVSEMVIERAKRLVEHGKDVVILLDSITRLARAYNLTVTTSGRTLSGGLDPAALHMPKRFFGAARNMREGGSLTILATALVETGSRMDDVVFEEFKGTGNMELVLDRSLSEKRIFPAIDLPKSSTRREDLLLSQSEMEANYLMRRAFNSMRSDDAVERIINMFLQTKTNVEFVNQIKRIKLF